jgi:hypothetical protein
MKYKLFNLFFIMALTFTVRAQYVAIPDTGFGGSLSRWGLGACLTGDSHSGWHLDTTCSAVLTDTILFCEHANIRNLSGIQYFKNLKNFSFAYNKMASLPALPATVRVLDCSFNLISSLSTLSDSLIELHCDSNRFASLPSSLPLHLSIFYCTLNRLTSLPALPLSLTDLNCGQNQFTTLPTLPAGLVTLVCQENYLSSLPALPSSLVFLYCNNNVITTLPALPAGLSIINCRINKLDSLPALPPLLTLLDCESNQLTNMPWLPDSIYFFWCDFNQLTALQNLPAKISNFSCRDNPNLSCLPHVPKDTLQFLNMIHTNIQCLPNRFTALTYDINPDTMQLCTAASGCPYTVTGIANASVESIQLYPNPNNGSCTLETSQMLGAEYTVYDMLGQIIQQQAITADVQRLDMGSVASGVYMLVIKGKNGSVRFTVMR